jgi:hypothetical protein
MCHDVGHAHNLMTIENRKEPKRYSIEDFSIAIPYDVKEPVTVEVEAKYRSAPQFLINDLLAKNAPVLPIFTMVKAEKTIESASV